MLKHDIDNKNADSHTIGLISKEFLYNLLTHSDFTFIQSESKGKKYEDCILSIINLMIRQRL